MVNAAWKSERARFQRTMLPYVALVNPGKYVSDRPGALEASKSRVKT